MKLTQARMLLYRASLVPNWEGFVFNEKARTGKQKPPKSGEEKDGGSVFLKEADAGKYQMSNEVELGRVSRHIDRGVLAFYNRISRLSSRPAKARPP
jgi:hypothetical protein